MFKHIFKASLNWILKTNTENSTKRIYQKSHSISIEGKEELQVSAAKAFKGDPSLHNPEDLLLSSLMSCHMMSYLYVCSQNGIEVLSYTDQAEATLETKADGSGQIIAINLYPKIKIADAKHKDLAIALHKKANQLCFIANSCKFPVYHHPSMLD